MIVAYDGGAYNGWQDNGQSRSIEAELTRVLKRILQHPVVLQAASRTDAGVHAEGQVVNFIVPVPSIDLRALLLGVNALLPKDIAVITLWQADNDFHPTLQNRGKEYHYHVCCDSIQNPLRRFVEWHYPAPLDIVAMRAAAGMMVGTHDFEAFCNIRKGLMYDSFVRTLTRIDIIELQNKCLRLEMEGSAFLYRMARNIVGTLVYVGCGKLQVDDLAAIIEGKDRTRAGMTAPAHGLLLKQVFLNN